MPKKLKTDYDLELTDLEPETEPETEPEPELRISKRTGKPVRPLIDVNLFFPKSLANKLMFDLVRALFQNRDVLALYC